MGPVFHDLHALPVITGPGPGFRGARGRPERSPHRRIPRLGSGGGGRPAVTTPEPADSGSDGGRPDHRPAPPAACGWGCANHRCRRAPCRDSHPGRSSPPPGWIVPLAGQPHSSNRAEMPVAWAAWCRALVRSSEFRVRTAGSAQARAARRHRRCGQLTRRDVQLQPHIPAVGITLVALGELPARGWLSSGSDRACRDPPPAH